MKIRTLVVEDDHATRKVLSRLLLTEGFEVRACAGGAAALDCLREGPCDAIVTDYEMPDMNGVELIRLAQGASPELHAVVVSGQEAPRGGADGILWLPKPVPFDLLVALLREGVAARDARRERSPTAYAPSTGSSADSNSSTFTGLVR